MSQAFFVLGVIMHYVYILNSKSGDRYYVGSSSNPDRRLFYHNTTEKGFTSRYRPWEIVFKQSFESKSLALKAERKVKSWKSRKMIKLLIEGKIDIQKYL